MEKIALCFIISYDHVLKKENIWKEWIEYNKDIINIYFYYKDKTKIKSEWIQQYCLPQSSCKYPTSYYHILPAYFSLMNYAYTDKKQGGINQWFCFLTDSCCPILPPSKFRTLFLQNKQKSIFRWKKAYWNPTFHKRANLALLPEELRLANDPWFVFCREDVKKTINFVLQKNEMVNTISKGGLANESLFAIILYSYNKLSTAINQISHITDWSKTESTTSPYVFKKGDQEEKDLLNKLINSKESKFVMFIRKIDSKFPDSLLKEILYPLDEKIKLEESAKQKKNNVRKKIIIRKIIFICFFLLAFSSFLSFFPFSFLFLNYKINQHFHRFPQGMH